MDFAKFATPGSVLEKKMFSRILQNPRERSCVGVLYLHGWSLLFNKVVGSSLAILFK